jgi:hypothetical protein
LTPDLVEAILDALAHGRPAQPGSQSGRRGAQAASGPTSLREAAKAAGIEG